MAVLAAIPQSPSTYDLVRNAVQICTIIVGDAPCPAENSQLVVPSTSEIAQRRDRVLDLMKSRSPLSGNAHSAEEYETAKTQPIVLVPQAGKEWLAAHFVWQVRNELATILCGDETTTCEKVDTGGYKVTTTLDWGMQQIAVFADGWRQPGSSVKPIDYAVGIEDRTLTAATMFMDVSTDFGKQYFPTQADFLERGPVRLRSALQFSLNVPAIKAGFYNGLDHQLQLLLDETRATFARDHQPAVLREASRWLARLRAARPTVFRRSPASIRSKAACAQTAFRTLRATSPIALCWAG